jgi:hypothetical protein
VLGRTETDVSHLKKEKRREPPNIDIYPFTPGSRLQKGRTSLSRPLQLPPSAWNNSQYQKEIQFLE